MIARKGAKHNKNPHRRYLFMAALFLLLVFFIINIFNTSIWDGQKRFTFIMQNISRNTTARDKNMAVFSIEPKKANGIYLLIQANTIFELPYGYDTYPAFSIYQLGELDKKRGGGALLKKSIETTLGVAVDGYLLSNQDLHLDLPKNREEYVKFKQNFFSFFSGINFLRQIMIGGENIFSDLSFMDRWKLWNTIRKLRPERIQFISLADTTMVNRDQLPDGSQVYLIDKEAFDTTLKNSFQDSVIRNSKITLEVQNATSQEKVANWFSRIIEHLGADVILKTTAKKVQQQPCRLEYADKSSGQSDIAAKLKDKYDCSEVHGVFTDNQTDIKIILGEGFIK